MRRQLISTIIFKVSECKSLNLWCKNAKFYFYVYNTNHINVIPVSKTNRIQQREKVNPNISLKYEFTFRNYIYTPQTEAFSVHSLVRPTSASVRDCTGPNEITFLSNENEGGLVPPQ